MGIRSGRDIRQRVGGAAVCLLAATAILAGCDAITQRAGPNATAEALASGLSGGDLNRVTFDGATSANVASFVTTASGDLKDVPRTVKATKVTQPQSNERTSTATLEFTWTLPTSTAQAGSTATSTGSTPAPSAGSDAGAGNSTCSTVSSSFSANGTATQRVTASCGVNSTSTGSSTGSAGGGGDNSSTGSSSASQVVWTYSTTATLNKGQDDKWHVAWAPAIFAPNLTANEHLALATVSAKRGDIVGANNTPLMSARAIVQVGIDKTKLTADQVVSAAGALAQVVGVDATAYTRSVTAAGPKAFVAAITVRADDPLVTSKAGAIAAIPGAVTVPSTSVIGPTPTFARSLLGNVGEATADVIAKSGGTLKPGDVVGLSGLEQRYDASLRGTPGILIQAVSTDAAGKTTKRDLFTSPPVDGKPLVISLDVTAQTVGEAVLQQAPQDSASALVAIRPSTGEIVAAANGPGSKGLPIGTTGQAAPGSTFKIVSTLALLRAGLTPDSTVPCTSTVTVGGRSFKNYNDYPASRLGDISLRTAFANSCNTAFIGSADKVSQADLATAGAALGIGVDLDLGFPAYLGSVPATATTTEHAASMIGQGKVLVSPLDMATVVASVVRGSAVRPKLLDDNPAAAKFPTPDKPLQPAEAQALQALMAAVVSEGSGAILADVGVTAAKTGTAEFGTATPPQTHAWMVAARGDLAVAVYVEVGESGSKTAGPLLKSFLQAYGG